MSDNVNQKQVDPEKIKDAIKGIVDHIVDLALEFVLPNTHEEIENETNEKLPKTPKPDK
jgi:hypothetical protein